MVRWSSTKSMHFQNVLLCLLYLEIFFRKVAYLENVDPGLNYLNKQIWNNLTINVSLKYFQSLPFFNRWELNFFLISPRVQKGNKFLTNFGFKIEILTSCIFFGFAMECCRIPRLAPPYPEKPNRGDFETRRNGYSSEEVQTRRTKNRTDEKNDWRRRFETSSNCMTLLQLQYHFLLLLLLFNWLILSPPWQQNEGCPPTTTTSCELRHVRADELLEGRQRRILRSTEDGGGRRRECEIVNSYNTVWKIIDWLIWISRKKRVLREINRKRRMKNTE